MELHKAIKDIVVSKGPDMINNIQIINYLLDYQAFKEKPATRLILRDVINAGYGEAILALQNTQGWQTKFKQYEHEFIDSCGYKEELAAYVFESIAYALGLNDGGNEEPAIKPCFDVNSFFDIPEVEVQQPANAPQNSNKQNPDPTDLYTIALSFYNEGKYQQAKGFIEKAINTQPNASIPSHHLRLLGDIYMRLSDYEEAIKCYNECFTQKAKEERCTIDQLRDPLRQHKVKGYESIMFFYFFCLYSAKRMSDAQWLQFVKGEARFGIMEAIKYCADNGINPVDDHFDIYFSDIRQLDTLDYLYEDGSFSHEHSSSKNILARILITTTSDFEKSQGWTHGYIIPCSTICKDFTIGEKYGYAVGLEFMWAKEKIDQPFPHTHYTIDDINHWKEIDKVDSEHFIKIDNYDDFPAFGAIKRLNTVRPVPLSGTSQWFLPSIGFFKRILSHTFLLPYGAQTCWTSSQSDQNNAILYSKTVSFRCENKYSRFPVLPIAVF